MTHRFFLGGRDLEMVEIRALLDRHAPGCVEDKHLALGGAALSAYRTELLAALARGEIPVIIELADDLAPDLFDRRRLVVVDHHGARAGADQPTSIEQVFALLRLPPHAWTRRFALVVANDRAHVAGLRAAGATAAEIAGIRGEDRAAQGVTTEDEIEAERAIAGRRLEGQLTVVETSSLTASTIADGMLPEMGGPGYHRLLVVTPKQVSVFGDGAAIVELGHAYPDAWWGGDLPNAGFWGRHIQANRPHEIEDLIARLR